MIGYDSPKQVASKLVEENQKLQKEVSRLQSIIVNEVPKEVWDYRAEAVLEFSSYICNQIELKKLKSPNYEVTLSRSDICEYARQFINNDKKKG